MYFNIGIQLILVQFNSFIAKNKHVYNNTMYNGVHKSVRNWKCNLNVLDAKKEKISRKDTWLFCILKWLWLAGVRQRQSEDSTRQATR